MLRTQLASLQPVELVLPPPTPSHTPPTQTQVRSMLRTQLASLQPVELVLPPSTCDARGAHDGGGGGAEPAPGGATLRVLRVALAGARTNVTYGAADAWTPGGAARLGRGGGGDAERGDDCESALALHAARLDAPAKRVGVYS
eukprot:353003-Chlamydomonas_euryale.AAC.6